MSSIPVPNNPRPLLQVERLTVQFAAGTRTLAAVSDLDLSVYPREIVGVVGESGSGKTQAMLATVGLLNRAASVSGVIQVEDRRVAADDRAALRAFRGRRIGMVFQDPMTALNPYMRIGPQLFETPEWHEKIGRKQALARACELLRAMSLPDPDRILRAYPHELSGGMRQRACLAMAMAGRPSLLIADEPTTALDVTVQAQIVSLLLAVRASSGIGMIVVSHDLGMVAGLCDRVVVMYAGRIVESAPAEQLYAAPRHPYTRALLASVPRTDRRTARADTHSPEPALQRSDACAFAARCPVRQPRCSVERPELRPMDDTGTVACHFPA